MTDANGKSSFNLFGIKAGSNWKGDAVSAPTLEYRDGVAGKETARFRAYDSVDACMQDYADFLQSHPHYRHALSAGDVASFSKALQQAGYATDPRYAEKIQQVAAQSVVPAIPRGGGYGRWLRRGVGPSKGADPFAAASAAPTSTSRVVVGAALAGRRTRCLKKSATTATTINAGPVVRTPRAERNRDG